MDEGWCLCRASPKSIASSAAGSRLGRPDAAAAGCSSKGADVLSFLQALVTNDVEGSPGAGVYAAYLTPQGRMIADLRTASAPGPS